MHVLIQVDGGSRGNPGPAAAGVTITDPAGRPIFEAGFHLEPMTNNQAEYHGLLYALREAKRLGATRLDIKADSELLVRQINGQYKVKNEGLRPLYASAVRQLQEFDDWRMVHVRREGNTRADELANLAMDAASDVIETDSQIDSKATPAAPPKATGSAGRTIVIRCTHACDSETCPVPHAAGWSASILNATPEGLCIHSAADVFKAVSSSLETGQPQSAACPRIRCGGRFSIEPGKSPPPARPHRTPKRS